MSSPPATEDPVEDIDFIGEEDDEDDEDDFVPGDEVEDDDDDDDASSTVVPLLDGVLFYGAQHAMHYQGEGFHLASSEAAPWNVLDSKVKPESDQCEFIMTGPCDFETAGAKATPRKLKVTFTVSEPPTAAVINGSGRDNSHDHITRKGGKAVVQHFEEDGGKHDSKTSGIYYRVFGTQVESNGGDLMEFLGGYYPPSTPEEKVGLVCQVRMIPAATTPGNGTTSSPQAAAPQVPMAVAAAAARIDDEDDDEYEEADENVDYNEIIALHEDAGMSVDDLKKRYREETEEDDDNKPASATRASAKKRKAAPPRPPPEEDDDDIDGF